MHGCSLVTYLRWRACEHPAREISRRATSTSRFEGDTVLVRREGSSVILEPVREWPDAYAESFAVGPDDLARPPQGEIEKRQKLG